MEALANYKLVEMQSIAAKRGVPLPQAETREARAALADALLSPAHMEIAVQDLSAAETEALQALVAAGGAIEARKFARDFGAIRKMGPNRLQREKPWESPVNPAESLWYRGFIFKDFHHTTHGPEEVIFIPADVKPALPIDSPPQKPTVQWEIATIPTHTIAPDAPAGEDLFCLLVYLQTHFVRLSPQDKLPAEHIRAIRHTFSHLNGDDDPTAAQHYFDFILHLARRMNFLRKQGGRLKLHAETVRQWLQSAPDAQLAALQKTWRADPTWNDLWHTPGLHPQPTGWENSPMLGRSKVLHHLSGIPRGEWVTIDGFIRAIKTIEPDFQRPDGNYETWYIHNDDNQPLMGFEHWDAVEGQFIRHMITGTLYALGIVSLGGVSAAAPPTVFQLTPAGDAFFRRGGKSSSVALAPQGRLRINPDDFTVRVTPKISLFRRFQLARIAEWVKRRDDGVVYQFSRAGYAKALEQSISLEQILGFLNRATNAQTPLQLVDALHRWDRRTGAVKLERLTVLRVNDADTLKEILQHPEIAPLLGPPLGPTAALVPERNIAAVETYLKKHGYL